MTILYECETDDPFDFNTEQLLHEIIPAALDYMQCPYETEVSVTLVDNPSIHAMNREYRNVDRPTDVLSFPLIEWAKPCEYDSLEDVGMDCFSPDSGELLLGDIVISSDKVVEQSEQYGHSKKREFCFLVVHSILHLLGYDHMEDNERIEMERLQKAILDQQGISREI